MALVSAALMNGWRWASTTRLPTRDKRLPTMTRSFSLSIGPSFRRTTCVLPSAESGMTGHPGRPDSRVAIDGRLWRKYLNIFVLTCLGSLANGEPLLKGTTVFRAGSICRTGRGTPRRTPIRRSSFSHASSILANISFCSLRCFSIIALSWLSFAWSALGLLCCKFALMFTCSRVRRRVSTSAFAFCSEASKT